MVKRRSLYILGILFIIGFSIYFSNLHNELFWDDEDWIINNHFVHSLSWNNIKFWFTRNTLDGVGLKSNYYRPFLFFTFSINYIISETNPFTYHLFSNFIHIFNSLLIFLIFKKLFNKESFAFLVSLLFLIHPLQTEAVNYIAGRGDLLVALFMLLGIWFFIKNQEKNSIFYTLLISLFLVLSILSRETAIIFPILLLVIYVSTLSRDRFLKSVQVGLIKISPYFAIVFVYGVLRLTVLNFLNTLNF